MVTLITAILLSSHTYASESNDLLQIIDLQTKSQLLINLGSSSGMVASGFKPAYQRKVGYLIGSIVDAIDASRNLKITSFTTTQMDGFADLAARHLSSDEPGKAYGTIIEDGAHIKSQLKNQILNGSCCKTLIDNQTAFD